MAKQIVDLVGRVFLSFIFLYEAYDSMFYFRETRLKMAFYGLVWQQEFLLYAAITLLVVGGLLVLLGYRASLGAFLLLLYWLPVTFVVHDFWNVPPDCMVEVRCAPLQLETTDLYRRMQGIVFMKNLAVSGGLLMVLVNGSGRLSVRRLFATTKVRGF
ncbi:MAG: hypothetical protein RLY31_1739 [Bacteroidota bacterium]